VPTGYRDRSPWEREGVGRVMRRGGEGSGGKGREIESGKGEKGKREGRRSIPANKNLRLHP